MIKVADAEGYPWAVAAGNAICDIFQKANAKATTSKSTGAKSSKPTGTILLDISTYDVEDIKVEFAKASVIVSVAVSLRQNRKERLGTNFADSDKLGVDQAGLDELHGHIDVMFLKTAEVTKILSGAPLGSEQSRIAAPWLMPAIQMWGKLAYRF